MKNSENNILKKLNFSEIYCLFEKIFFSSSSNDVLYIFCAFTHFNLKIKWSEIEFYQFALILAPYVYLKNSRISQKKLDIVGIYKYF